MQAVSRLHLDEGSHAFEVEAVSSEMDRAANFARSVGPGAGPAFAFLERP